MALSFLPGALAGGVAARTEHRIDMKISPWGFQGALGVVLCTRRPLGEACQSGFHVFLSFHCSFFFQPVQRVRQEVLYVCVCVCMLPPNSFLISAVSPPWQMCGCHKAIWCELSTCPTNWELKATLQAGVAQLLMRASYQPFKWRHFGCFTFQNVLRSWLNGSHLRKPDVSACSHANIYLPCNLQNHRFQV